MPSLDLTELQREFTDLNGDLTKNLKTISSFIENMIQNFRNDPEQLNTSDGISFLNMKNLMMIEYIANLLNLINMKIKGKQLNDSSCVNRLAELRCIIEKSKSIEVKLKYQIDKLLKIAVSQDLGEENPLSFKANANNFADDSNDEAIGDELSEKDDDDIITKEKHDDEDEDFDENLNKKKKDGIYVPPKLAPVYNDIDLKPQDKFKKELERQKRRAIHSSVMMELENEYSGAPEEIKNAFGNVLERETAEEKHKIEYEEDNFVRKALTKNEMMRVKRLRKGTNLDSLASFGDSGMFLNDNINMEDYMASKKLKKKEKKKGKKGKGKKRKIRYT